MSEFRTTIGGISGHPLPPPPKVQAPKAKPPAGAPPAANENAIPKPVLSYRNPEDDVVVLKTVYGLQKQLNTWTTYSFNTDFETPTDGWHFTLGADGIDDATKKAVYEGQRVELSVNGHVIGGGYIEEITREVSPSGGTEWRIEGKDVLAGVVASHVDPRVQFKKDATIEDVVKAAFADFGFDKFVFDDRANRGAMVGRVIKRTDKGKVRKNKKVDQLRPQQHEGAFAFAQRIANHQGLWIWASADGESIIVDEPDYDQEPLYTLVRNADGSGNILSGAPKTSIENQPSILVADGISGSVEFGHSKIRAYCVNPITGLKPDGTTWGSILLILQRYPDARQIVFPAKGWANFKIGIPEQPPVTRPLFLHSESSTNHEQLEAYVRREMSLRLRHYLSVTYTVVGHGQTSSNGGAFVPFVPNTMVRVFDVPGDINANMWVHNVTYDKDATGGTTTKLGLIVPGSLTFSHEAT